MRIAILFAILGALNGCALGIPPAISAVSYAGDGASYLATGKSLTDHALSDALGRDCALFRVFRDKKICHDFTYEEARRRAENRRTITPPRENSIASLDSMHYERRPGEPETAIAQVPAPGAKGVAKDRGPTARELEPIQRAFIAERVGAAGAGLAARTQVRPRPKPPAPVAPAIRRLDLSHAPAAHPASFARRTPAVPVAAAHSRPARYVVLASFRARAKAQRFARRLKGLETMVAPADTGKRGTYYRVIAVPGSAAELDRTLHAARQAGIARPWTIRVCAAGASAGRCMPPVAGGRSVAAISAGANG